MLTPQSHLQFCREFSQGQYKRALRSHRRNLGTSPASAGEGEDKLYLSEKPLSNRGSHTLQAIFFAS